MQVRTGQSPALRAPAHLKPERFPARRPPSPSWMELLVAEKLYQGEDTGRVEYVGYRGM